MTTPDPVPAAAPTEPAALRLMRLNWSSTVRRDAAGFPTLPATFVAEQGQLVRILDVRDLEELTGPLGHIPAVTHVPLERLGDVPQVLDRETCVVVVSGRGERAGVAARYLESLGMKRVACMEGGMAAWKALGFSCPRDAGTFRQTLRAIAPGLGRDGRPLASAGKKGRLTLMQIEDHIGDATSVRWVKLAAFLLHGKRSCVDGRDDHGVIGTPGGDAGELLLGLAAAERLTGRAFLEADVARLLERHVDTFGRFYMHSDMHAMNALIIDGLRKDERVVPHIGDVFEATAWRTWLKAPPLPVRAALLDHLTRPQNMGCGHLRFAMTDDATYGVRPDLARMFLRAFHELRWAGAPELEWVVLGGEHTESAVANVLVDGELHTYTRIPLVSPMVAGQQMFVNHPQVTTFLRRELAALLTEAGVCAPSDERALFDGIEAQGGTQGAATLGKLAKGLPVFELHFALDGGARVRAAGEIAA